MSDCPTRPRSRRTGRPRVGPAITVHLPAEMVDRLDRVARRDGTSRAVLIRYILRMWLKEFG